MPRKKKKKKGTKNASPLMRKWLKAYLSYGSATYLNATLSAEAAGYKVTRRQNLRHVGWQNKQRYAAKIAKWLDDEGLSDNELKIRLIELLDRKKTIPIKLKGAVKQEDLPPNHRLIVCTGTLDHDADGISVFSDGESLIEIDMEDSEIQRRTLDMALDVKGLKAPQKQEVTGKNGKAIEHKLIVEVVKFTKDDCRTKNPTS